MYPPELLKKKNKPKQKLLGQSLESSSTSKFWRGLCWHGQMGGQPSFDCTWELFDAGDGGAVPLLLPARATAVLSPGQHVAPTQPERRSQKQDRKGLFLIFLFFFFTSQEKRKKKKGRKQEKKNNSDKKKGQS